MNTPKKVLFVCLGNICRSPMAEGLFLHHLEEQGLTDYFEVDSAGTAGYHIGSLADPRMRATAQRHGVVLPSRARQFVSDDLYSFDHILAMDSSNYIDILALSDGNHTANVQLMREYEPSSGRDVPDPYYGGDDGFEEVFHLLDKCCTNLLNHLVDQEKSTK